MNNLQGKPYRIEERGWPNGNVPTLEFADRTEAVLVFDGIWRAAHSLYSARPGLRLVLVGPDHKVMPGGVR